MKVFNYVFLYIALAGVFGVYAMDSENKDVEPSDLERIVEQFLHKPKVFKSHRGSLSKDMSRMLGCEVIQKITISPSVLNNIPVSSVVLDPGGDIGRATLNAVGDRILLNCGAFKTKLMDSKSGEVIAEVANDIACFNKNGDVVLSFLGKKAVMFDARTGKMLTEWWIANSSTRPARIRSAHINEASNKVLLMVNDGTWELFRFTDGTIETASEGQHERVRFGAFTHNGDRFITCGRSLKMWDAETGEHLLDMKESMGGLEFTALFSPDDTKVLIAGNTKEPKLFTVDTGECVMRLKSDEVATKVRLNSTVDTIITTENGSDFVKVWDVKTASCVKRLTYDKQMINDIQFSPSGNLMVTGSGSAILISANPLVVLWDAKTGQCLKVLRTEKPDGVSSVDFNSAGDQIIAAYNSGMVKIFDLKEFLEIHSFLENTILLDQALLLYCIFEVVRARALLEKHGSERVFEEDAQKLSKEKLVFHLDKYPHLREVYASLPGSITVFLDGYVQGAK